jgi:hypothetical protein
VDRTIYNKSMPRSQDLRNSQKGWAGLVQASSRLPELDALIFMALQTPGISARLGCPVASVKTAKLLASAYAIADQVA